MKRSLQRAMQQTDRYRLMKQAGASDEEIQKAFNTPVQMTIFTYQGEKDVQMTPMDSIRYYKSFLRSGLVSIDPSNGYVKAYVGGLDYTHFQYDMAMVGRRQVGSTMKPFVYTMAMEDGYTPNSTILNVQRTYGGWTPRNSSRSRYGEAVTLKWGLSQSNNWITAELMYQIDPYGTRLVDNLHEFGVANNRFIHRCRFAWVPAKSRLAKWPALTRPLSIKASVALRFSSPRLKTTKETSLRSLRRV